MKPGTDPHGVDADRVASSVRTLLDTDRSSEMLGIQVLFAEHGQACAQMLVREDMVNGHSVAHGGLVFSLADTTFACAVNSFGPLVVTAAADIAFVRPAFLGDLLTAEAELRTRLPRSVICDVTIRRGEEVVAEFRARGQQFGARSTEPATTS